MVEKNYDTMYHALGHYNISKNQFIRECKEKEQRQKSAHDNFVNLRLGKVNFRFPLDYKSTRNQAAVQRTIVIDGANVMHSGATTIDKRHPGNHHMIPDVMALLALTRFFVWRDFEVIIVISRKYYMANSTNYKVAIDELVKHNLCTIANQTNLDDVLALEMAAAVNGIVLTSDLFRDHQSERRYRNMVKLNWLGLEWKHINKADRCSRTRDNNFIPNKVFEFKKQDGSLFTDNNQIDAALYSDPNTDIRHEITRDHREQNWTIERKNEVLEVVNRLIVDGILICPENEERIMLEPIHKPTANLSYWSDEEVENVELDCEW